MSCAGDHPDLAFDLVSLSVLERAVWAGKFNSELDRIEVESVAEGSEAAHTIPYDPEKHGRARMIIKDKTGEQAPSEAEREAAAKRQDRGAKAKPIDPGAEEHPDGGTGDQSAIQDVPDEAARASTRTRAPKAKKGPQLSLFGQTQVQPAARAMGREYARSRLAKLPLQALLEMRQDLLAKRQTSRVKEQLEDLNWAVAQRRAPEGSDAPQPSPEPAGPPPDISSVAGVEARRRTDGGVTYLGTRTVDGAPQTVFSPSPDGPWHPASAVLAESLRALPLIEGEAKPGGDSVGGKEASRPRPTPEEIHRMHQICASTAVALSRGIRPHTLPYFFDPEAENYCIY